MSAPSSPQELIALCQSAWRALDPSRRASVEHIARKLGERGHRAWLVGGAVRDLVLGQAVGDLDMVSKATPDEALAIFPNARAIGKSFGIVQVDPLDPQAGEPIELATFRLERGYADGRRPDEVQFTDRPELDANRRDFTCNALFFDPLTEDLLDPTGGLQDLAARELRTVGAPEDRFAEDGLRLLRVARFLARLDLRPSPGLLTAARASRDSLRGVSPERIYGEFVRMAQGPRPVVAWAALHAADVLRGPFQAPEWDDEAAWNDRTRLAPSWFRTSDEHGLLLWLALGVDPNFAMVLAPHLRREETARRLKGLCVPNQIHQAVTHLIEWLWTWRALASHGAPQFEHPEEVIRILRAPFGPLSLDLALHNEAEPEHWREHLAGTKQWFENLPSERVWPSFLPTGRDWLQAGLPAGPRLGALLTDVENAAMRGEIIDREEALLFGRKLIRALNKGSENETS